MWKNLQTKVVRECRDLIMKDADCQKNSLIAYYSLEYLSVIYS